MCMLCYVIQKWIWKDDTGSGINWLNCISIKATEHYFLILKSLKICTKRHDPQRSQRDTDSSQYWGHHSPPSLTSEGQESNVLEAENSHQDDCLSNTSFLPFGMISCLFCLKASHVFLLHLILEQVLNLYLFASLVSGIFISGFPRAKLSNFMSDTHSPSSDQIIGHFSVRAAQYIKHHSNYRQNWPKEINIKALNTASIFSEIKNSFRCHEKIKHTFSYTEVQLHL